MRISDSLLSFLANASWQLIFIAAIASACAWLLRNSAARYRHRVWVAALVISLALPLLSQMDLKAPLRSLSLRTPAITPMNVQKETVAFIKAEGAAGESTIANSATASIKVNQKLAAILLAGYFSLLFYRVVKLLKAWRRTRVIRTKARPIEPSDELAGMIARCKNAIEVEKAEIRTSTIVSVPVTVGARRPVVILPEQLVSTPSKDVFVSALGHELVHVSRRDYLRNLLYELAYLPISFHPAAALVKRRINQTRELTCDELVTEKLLPREAYARSLVQLAGSAMPFSRREATLTVGITDADILEVRIMTLLEKSKTIRPRGRLLLLAASMLLLTPCVAAAAFGLGFDLAVQDPTPTVNETAVRAKAVYRADPEYTEDARENKIEGTVGLMASINEKGLVQHVQVTKPLYPSLDRSAVETLKKWRFEPMIKDGRPAEQKIGVEMVFRMQDSQEEARRREREEKEHLRRAEEDMGETLQRAEQDRTRNREAEERELRERAERDPQFRAELEARQRHEQEERKAMLVAHTTLARTAKITMEQAIQIANGQYPGKVMECSLVGEGWESLGKLGKDGHVLYHVVIISADDQNPTFTHVMVNALDGSIYKTRKEERNP